MSDSIKVHLRYIKSKFSGVGGKKNDGKGKNNESTGNFRKKTHTTHPLQCFVGFF